MSDSFEKEMAYLKGFLKGRKFTQSLHALQFAKACHEGQTRISGEPYISHPVRVCTILAALNVDDDNTLAVALLHDVVEDCNVSVTVLKLNGFNDDVICGVDALSKKAGQDNNDYYWLLMESTKPYILLVKLCDRAHNISTMAGAFNAEKINKYVIETETLVYALFTHAKEVIPEYSDQLFILKSQLESLLKAYKLFLSSIVKEEVK